ncbi:hypothetical protein [Rhodoblastus sphagnicola]|uniref:hypothetical protein n=1 Tax=Rhodoblastus sphagnicola TaxID=333368 RepID=UPI003CC86429
MRHLFRLGHRVGRHRIARLMRKMGLTAAALSGAPSETPPTNAFEDCGNARRVECAPSLK